MLRNSIRLRLLILLLLLALAPLAAIGYLTANRDAQNAQDSAANALRDQATRTASSVAQTAGYYVSIANYLANLQATRTAVTLHPVAQVPNPFDDQARSLNAAAPRITGIYLVKPDATFIRGGALAEPSTFGPATGLPAVPGTPAPLPQLIAIAAHGDQAVRIAYAQYVADRAGDLWVAARVLDRGNALGVLLLRVDGSVLLQSPAVAGGDPAHGISVQVVADNYIYDSSTLALVAQGHIPVVQSVFQASLTTVEHPGMSPMLQSSDVVTYDDLGHDYTAIAVAVPGFPAWRVVARQPTAEIVAAGTANRATLLAAGILIALALTIGIFLAITASVIRPLARMRDAVLGISQGRFDRPLEVRGSDELGGLAASIEAMRRDLHADAQTSAYRTQQISAQVVTFTEALEPIAEGQLFRRIPVVDDPESPLLDAVEATNNLIRRFRRLVAGLKEAVGRVVYSSSVVSARIAEAAQEAARQQDLLEQQRQRVRSMSQQAVAAGQAAADTASATEEVNAGVQAGGVALAAVATSGDGIRQRTLENTNRIKKLQDTAINLTGLVQQVQDMAGSLQLLAYNGTLSATRAAGGDPAFARMAEETQSLAASFETSLSEIKIAVEAAQRDIGAVILSSEAVAQDVIASLHARDELSRVFSTLTEMVQILSASASSSSAKAAEQTRLAASVHEGNDLLAQAYQRIRMNLEGAAEEIALRAVDFDRLAASVADLQVEHSHEAMTVEVEQSAGPEILPVSAA